jgi:hypothetical protein
LFPFPVFVFHSKQYGYIHAFGLTALTLSIAVVHPNVAHNGIVLFYLIQGRITGKSKSLHFETVVTPAVMTVVAAAAISIDRT